MNDPHGPVEGQATEQSVAYPGVSHEANEVGREPARFSALALGQLTEDESQGSQRFEAVRKGIAERENYEGQTRRADAELDARIKREDRELAMREKAQDAKDKREDRRSLAAFIREMVLLAILVAVTVAGLITQTSYMAYGGFGGAIVGGLAFAGLAYKRGKAEAKAARDAEAADDAQDEQKDDR